MIDIGGMVSDYGYAAGWQLVRALPDPVARTAFDLGARFAARDGGPDQLRRNLARVTGVAPGEVPDALILASMESYARYWREVFRLPSVGPEQLRKDTEGILHGREHFDAALAAGAGMILALPHSGNWDMAGVAVVQRYGRFTTVAERLQPESLYRRFLEFRESLGFEIVPLTGGDRPPTEVLAERLRANGMVALLADRDLTRRGVEVQFFGEQTRMPSGPAKLAIETGAALHPTHCWNTPDGWVVDILPALDTGSGDVTAVTQALADVFAERIAAHPQDWHMLQPQWIADLSAERRARLAEPPDTSGGPGFPSAARPQASTPPSLAEPPDTSGGGP